jgi:hypothetical protein
MLLYDAVGGPFFFGKVTSEEEMAPKCFLTSEIVK